MGKQVTISDVTFRAGELPLIAGPCVIESRAHSLEMAEAIKIVTEKLKVPFIFKSSFDKANRSTVGSFRGLNMEEGLNILAEVKSEDRKSTRLNSSHALISYAVFCLKKKKKTKNRKKYQKKENE